MHNSVERSREPELADVIARLSVQNGTTTSGIARKLQDELLTDGFDVVDLSAAPNQGTYPHATITDYSSGKKPNTIQALANRLGISPSSVKTGDPAKAPKANTDGLPVDIVVVAGDDRLK